MSSTKFLIAIAVVVLIGCVHCHAAEDGQQSVPSKTIDDSSDQLDQETIMVMCNESFRTSMGLYPTFNSNCVTFY